MAGIAQIGDFSAEDESVPAVGTLLSFRAKSRNPVAVPFDLVAGCLDFARHDGLLSVDIVESHITAAPLQFLADNAEEGNVGQRRQGQRFLRLANGDCRTSLHVNRLAAIQC